MDQVKSKKAKEKAIIIAITVTVLGLFAFFLSDIFIPFIKLQLANDVDGAKEYLISKGFAGYFTVIVVEALQMVVVFISAEFIQITSGMSYPIWLSIILCDLGVMLGSSIIYLLVNVFKFDGNPFAKKSKIEKYERKTKTKSSVILMYLLFIMPIIPFGAICYYGSGKKIPYFRYLFTCATGTIPSIITSIVMGTAIKEFISRSLPIWALVLIIIAAAAVLFILLAIVIKKFFISPNSKYGFFSFIIDRLVNKIALSGIKYRFINEEAIKDLNGPFICISEHHSAYDVFLIRKLMEDKNLCIVGNEYYMRIPVANKLLKKSGYIKKKMFYTDIPCVKNILYTLNVGYPVLIFPEGRLSTDGGPSHFEDSIANLSKKTDVPLVLIQIRNDYFIKPKWRKAKFGGEVEVEVKKVFSAKELSDIGKDELYGIMKDVLSYNDFSNKNLVFKQRNKAKGLENILYMCPHCRTLYSNESNGNSIRCTACGRKYTIGNNYRFEDGDVENIYDYYGRIKDIERESLDKTDMNIPVDVKIFTDGVKKYRTEKGVFTLTAEKLSFRSDISDLYFEYTIEMQEGIAYSAGEEFELYYNNELYYFYPSEDSPKICTRVALVFELLKEKAYEKREKQADKHI